LSNIERGEAETSDRFVIVILKQNLLCLSNKIDKVAQVAFNETDDSGCDD